MSNTQIESEISITEKAVKEIKRIMEENKITPDCGLRIGVKGGGCSGLTYSLGFDPETRDGDMIIEQNGVKLFVDGKSLFYLSGTELDFSDGLNGKGFIFNNPNATKSCGCGESFGV
ncbi:MAG: iron-sulfur cluster insertion protein ErpA [Ignavibacteriaceae bacterium]|nr:iron-sulfur cluster insertion protein ErpA [Ignavibacterium sp.]MCC6254907.1 iron-sulfur cluster insertion protein ErpA [Ignavibacteriaceae bacterium]HRN27397.1 iron-sulfur cluster insertion protein ErpA [Ignavibacteriaceae bacterium]HRQ55070.1 iron-sulfur cluster insertion protein ErpA [Ignavibacteriaceae bacterium]